MSGIGIITNPHSKLNKRNPKRAELLGYILGEKGQLEVTSSLEDLARVAREFRERDISILAINGGDGTICRTITAFVSEYGAKPLPQIALLRGGTINVLANNLGVIGKPEQILYRLVEGFGRSEGLTVTKLRSMKVEGNYGFLFGNGVAATFLKEYYKRKTGPIGAFLWCVGVWASRFVGGAMHYRVVKDIDIGLAPNGLPAIRHNSVAVFFSSLQRMPLGYPMFERLKKEPGPFQAVSFTFQAREAIWKLPFTVIKRKDGSTTGKLSFCARSLVLEAQGPFDYTLDGELYVSGSRSLAIEQGPELEFVTV